MVTAPVAAWDSSRDVAGARACDVSGNDRHGRVFNLPARAVTGHNFGGEATCFRLAPERGLGVGSGTRVATGLGFGSARVAF